MKVYTCYGFQEVPRFDTIQVNNSSSCPICNTASGGKFGTPYKPKKHKKGDKVVYLALNSGPTGRFFFCLKHAKRLRDDLTKLLAAEK